MSPAAPFELGRSATAPLVGDLGSGTRSPGLEIAAVAVDAVRTRRELVLENAVLRHQGQAIALLFRSGPGRRWPSSRRPRAEFRVALTGTPLENHLGELRSLFAVVFPGLLGSWDQFHDRFASPIERSRDPDAQAALARVIRPFLLRRTKPEAARELPARCEVVVRWCACLSRARAVRERPQPRCSLGWAAVAVVTALGCG